MSYEVTAIWIEGVGMIPLNGNFATVILDPQTGAVTIDLQVPTQIPASQGQGSIEKNNILTHISRCVFTLK